MAHSDGLVMTEFHPEGGVVVGDDGSDGAATAIRAARQEAMFRQVGLHVVRAWSLTSAVRPPGVPLGIVPSMTEFEDATLAAERQHVERVLNGAIDDVAVYAVHGSPASVLLGASASAELLVVGTRGLGGFKSLLLGSVAEQCVRHAQCSVLVVRK